MSGRRRGWGDYVYSSLKEKALDAGFTKLREVLSLSLCTTEARIGICSSIEVRFIHMTNIIRAKNIKFTSRMDFLLTIYPA